MNILKRLKDKNKLKKVFPVILLLFLITIIIGVTYAMYSITLNSSENSITTGLVSMSYTESTNVIDIKNALPMSDIDGKTSSNYFDFSITSSLTLNENDPDTKVNYSIELEPLSIDDGYSALTEEQIKVYLENITTNEVLVDSVLISELDNYKLYNSTHTHKYSLNNITTNYRLRAWIDYNVDSTTWNETNKYEYKFRININSDVGEVGEIEEAPAYCFELIDKDDTAMTATIYNYKCSTTTQHVEMTENINDDQDGLKLLPKTIDYNQNGLTLLEDETYPIITDVKIPEVIDGYKITKIGETAFAVKNLTSVIIPDSVITIEKGAFCENENNTSVIIGDGVTTIGEHAFQSDGGVILGISRENCGIVNLKLGNSVTTIGQAAFYDNKLTSLTIPDSVTTIGYDAFAHNFLTSLTLGDNVTSIGSYAFAFNNLTSVIIPSSVTAISDDSFSNNILTSITIPSSVTTIGDNAFYKNSLTSVKIKGKLSSSDFTSYGYKIWGWADGYSDSDIIWNYTE